MQFVVVDVAAADQAIGTASVGRGGAAAMQIEIILFYFWVGKCGSMVCAGRGLFDVYCLWMFGCLLVGLLVGLPDLDFFL